MTLPDPRHWRTPPADSTVHALAAASLKGDTASRATLRLELDALLDKGDASAVPALLRDAPTADSYRHLQQMLAKLVNKPERGEVVIARLFAIPLVIVAGAKKTLQLPDALPGIAAVCDLLEQHGVLGGGRNFGLGNALVAMETLDSLSPRLLRQWAAQLRTGGAPLELAGSAIQIKPGREQVYLRFLVGASVTPAHVPALEATADVGKWGMPVTKLLAQQLAQPGLEVLPIARAPVALYLASDAGRAAQIELAFSLFLSNEVRKFRMSVGEPTVVLSAHRTPKAVMQYAQSARRRGLGVLIVGAGGAAHLAGAVAAHAMHTGFGLEMLLVAIIDQRVQPLHTFHPDIAAASAVPAVGSAEFNKFLAAERDTARTPVAGADIDFGFIKKFHNGSSKAGRR